MAHFPVPPRKVEVPREKIMLDILKIMTDLGEFPTPRKGKKLSKGWGPPYRVDSALGPPVIFPTGLRSRRATGSPSPGYPDRLANLRRSGCFQAEPYPPKFWPDSSVDGPGNGVFSGPTKDGFKLSSNVKKGVWTTLPRLIEAISGHKPSFKVVVE